MKKVFILSQFCLILFTSCYLKEYVINKNIKVKMPAGATVVPQEELTGSEEAFRRSDKVYSYDGMLVSLTQNTDDRLRGVSLDQYKATQLYNFKKVFTNLTADIETVNGKRFLVLNSDSKLTNKQFSQYCFNSDTQTGRPIIVGFIHYDRATQQEKAQKLLKTLLANVED